MKDPHAHSLGPAEASASVVETLRVRPASVSSPVTRTLSDPAGATSVEVKEIVGCSSAARTFVRIVSRIERRSSSSTGVRTSSSRTGTVTVTAASPINPGA